ncbi:unnamed protein product [Linum tenue]|uniref:TF-B3 domain-containing protein n=1 Tax=Linum tenue TaxID=586396 RepID=A0AAV0QA91_9ROSI|nr:unnamed protein product [Linum tenue]
MSSSIRDDDDDYADLHRHDGHMSSVSPRFFKVIVHDTLRDKKLMLPKKFTSILKQETGRDPPKQATLGLPNGTAWDMEVVVAVDDGGGVWLRNGFASFAEYCSLEHGCLLLFKHRGEFQFSVRVYGNTAVEIRYPSDSTAASRSSGGDGKDEEDLFSDLPEEDVSSSFEDGGPGGDDDEEDEDSDYDYSEESSEGDDEFEGTSWSNSTGRKKKNNKNKKKQTAAASSSQRHRGEPSSYPSCGRPPSSNDASIGVPPSFTATMTETYISLRQAYIPREFSERYMKESERVGLKVGEKVWEMKLTKLGGEERKRKNTRITGGWTSFARDNNLRIGDVCFFQLFDSARHHYCRRPLLHVTILRNPGHQGGHHHHVF